MADRFTDFETKICADWLNNVDWAVVDALGNPRSPEDVLNNINALARGPNDNQLYAVKNGILVPFSASEFDHSDLQGTSQADQHPIESITGLRADLDKGIAAFNWDNHANAGYAEPPHTYAQNNSFADTLKFYVQTGTSTLQHMLGSTLRAAFTAAARAFGFATGTVPYAAADGTLKTNSKFSYRETDGRLFIDPGYFDCRAAGAYSANVVLRNAAGVTPSWARINFEHEDQDYTATIYHSEIGRLGLLGKEFYFENETRTAQAKITRDFAEFYVPIEPVFMGVKYNFTGSTNSVIRGGDKIGFNRAYGSIELLNKFLNISGTTAPRNGLPMIRVIRSGWYRGELRLTMTNANSGVGNGFILIAMRRQSDNVVVATWRFSTPIDTTWTTSTAEIFQMVATHDYCLEVTDPILNTRSFDLDTGANASVLNLNYLGR